MGTGRVLLAVATSLGVLSSQCTIDSTEPQAAVVPGEGGDAGEDAIAGRAGRSGAGGTGMAGSSPGVGGSTTGTGGGAGEGGDDPGVGGSSGASGGQVGQGGAADAGEAGNPSGNQGGSSNLGGMCNQAGSGNPAGGSAGDAPGSTSFWQFGTPNHDAGRVALDASDNVYVVGHTRGEFAGPRDEASYDCFVRKHDSSGTHLWTQQFGTWSDDFVEAAAADASGNLYVVGTTYGDLEGTSAGMADCVVRKYGPDGTPLWTRQFGTAANDGASGVAVDASGNVYVGGFLQTEPETVTNADAFVRKYDPSGTLLWTELCGSSGNDSGSDVAVGADGKVYVTGTTLGDLDGTSQGDRDVFVCKYDSSGTREWTRQFGTSGFDVGGAVTADSCGNVYVAGQTDGDLGGTLQGRYDAFVRKYDVAGTHQWTQQYASLDHEGAEAVALDASGSVYVAGFTITPPERGDLSDGLLLKYAPDGTLRWALPFGAPGSDGVGSVALDTNGTLYTAGYTDGSLGGPSAGATDAFVMRMTWQ